MPVTEREMVVAAAERWRGTPYQHAQRCHGAGIDCINLLCAAYGEAGLIRHIELPYYPADWMLHRNQELILTGLLEQNMRQVEQPLPGDIALFRFGRCYSHGTIVVDWPRVIHAFAGLGVVYGDARNHPLLDGASRPRAVKFYSMLSVMSHQSPHVASDEHRNESGASPAPPTAEHDAANQVRRNQES